MSEFMDLCSRRQTCRGFADKPVEHEKLLSCIEAARLAPSACNSQPWSFLIAESPDKAALVAQAGQQLGANAYASEAKAFIAIVEEHAVLLPVTRKLIDSQYFAKGDLGAAAAYLCLEAEAQGLGICQIGIFDREAICKVFDIPIEKKVAALFAVGYPKEAKVRPKIRKPIEDIVTFI